MGEAFMLRNVLASHQRRDRSRAPTDSNCHAGHEGRMAWHMMRVRNHPCPCGSGKRYRACCLGKRRCKSCGRAFRIRDDGPERCPACGSEKVYAPALREVCG